MEAANKTSTLASCLQVFRLSFRRQFFTRQTIVMVLLLGLAYAWRKGALEWVRPRLPSQEAATTPGRQVA